MRLLNSCVLFTLINLTLAHAGPLETEAAEATSTATPVKPTWQTTITIPKLHYPSVGKNELEPVPPKGIKEKMFGVQPNEMIVGVHELGELAGLIKGLHEDSPSSKIEIVSVGTMPEDDPGVQALLNYLKDSSPEGAEVRRLSISLPTEQALYEEAQANLNEIKLEAENPAAVQAFIDANNTKMELLRQEHLAARTWSQKYLNQEYLMPKFEIVSGIFKGLAGVSIWLWTGMPEAGGTITNLDVQTYFAVAYGAILDVMFTGFSTAINDQKLHREFGFFRWLKDTRLLRWFNSDKKIRIFGVDQFFAWVPSWTFNLVSHQRTPDKVPHPFYMELSWAGFFESWVGKQIAIVVPDSILGTGATVSLYRLKDKGLPNWIVTLFNQYYSYTFFLKNMLNATGIASPDVAGGAGLYALWAIIGLDFGSRVLLLTADYATERPSFRKYWSKNSRYVVETISRPAELQASNTLQLIVRGPDLNDQQMKMVNRLAYKKEEPPKAELVGGILHHPKPPAKGMLATCRDWFKQRLTR